MARTVLVGNPNRRATGRAAALSHASPTASSNRLLKGALLGNCGTFSILIPQSVSRADQLPIAPLAPNPQLQRLRLFVDLVPVHPIPRRPSQQFGELLSRKPPGLPKSTSHQIHACLRLVRFLRGAAI
jgi:hypothetical protein